MSFELYQLEKFAKATGQENRIVEYYQDKFDHASSAKESMEIAYRIAKHQAQSGTVSQGDLAAQLEKAYQEISGIRFIAANGDDPRKKPSAAQSIANGFIDASLFGINCSEAVKWYQRTLSGILETTDPKDLAAVYQDMGRCYLWAPDGDALKRDPIKAREALKKAYSLVEKGDFPVYRGEMPHPARLQEIASLLTDSCLETGNEKEALTGPTVPSRSSSVRATRLPPMRPTPWVFTSKAKETISLHNTGTDCLKKRVRPAATPILPTCTSQAKA